VTEDPSFDTTSGSNLSPPCPAYAGVNNVIVVDDPGHIADSPNNSVLDGRGTSINTVSFGTNDPYDFTDLADFSNIQIVDFGTDAAPDDAVDFEDTLTMTVSQNNTLSTASNAGSAIISLSNDGSSTVAEALHGVGTYELTQPSTDIDLHTNSATEVDIDSSDDSAKEQIIEIGDENYTGRWDGFSSASTLEVTDGLADVTGVTDGSDQGVLGGLTYVNFANGVDKTLRMMAAQVDALTTVTGDTDGSVDAVVDSTLSALDFSGVGADYAGDLSVAGVSDVTDATLGNYTTVDFTGDYSLSMMAAQVDALTSVSSSSGTATDGTVNAEVDSVLGALDLSGVGTDQAGALVVTAAADTTGVTDLGNYTDVDFAGAHTLTMSDSQLNALTSVTNQTSSEGIVATDMDAGGNSVGISGVTVGSFDNGLFGISVSTDQDDTITLFTDSTVGSASAEINFGVSAANSRDTTAGNTITNFDAGADGDVLDFEAFLGADYTAYNNGGSPVADGSTSEVDILTQVAFYSSDSLTKDDFATDAEFADIDGKAVVIGNGDGNGDSNVWFVDSSLANTGTTVDDSGDIQLVGTVDAFTNMIDANVGVYVV